jgi:hypothetical protein
MAHTKDVRFQERRVQRRLRERERQVARVAALNDDLWLTYPN